MITENNMTFDNQEQADEYYAKKRCEFENQRYIEKEKKTTRN